MKLKELMTRNVVTVNPEESVAVAARMLSRYNIGSMPVCSREGRLLGLVTDRDLVTRCMASGGTADMRVRDVMTSNLVTASPDMEAGLAAGLMGRKQIRRLPVVEKGRLCGMVSLGDLANREESIYDAGDALAEISSNISVRD